jgi:hypothetical protein
LTIAALDISAKLQSVAPIDAAVAAVDGRETYTESIRIKGRRGRALSEDDGQRISAAMPD